MAEIEFWKMHGLGNDYIVIDNSKFNISEDKLGKIAEILCRRKFSVGADGLILVEDPRFEDADVRMRIFNLDGGEAEMCGNGIRCLAKYVYESGIVKKTRIIVETLAGFKTIELKVDGFKVNSVKVDIGKPLFNRTTKTWGIHEGQMTQLES